MTLNILWMQPGLGDPDIDYSGLDDRKVLDALVPSEGILASGALLVTQRAAGANFSVDVAAGYAVVTGDDVAGQGKYLIQNTAAYNLAVPTPPGSGTRTHRIVAQVRDKLHNSSSWSTYDWVPVCVPDTTGSGPPGIPNSAISLATVVVANGQASVLDANITNGPPTAVLAGTSAATTLYIRKPADQSRTSNTTLIDDTDLQLTMAAFAEYRLELDLLYSADSGGDLKFGFSFPSGAGVDLVVTGLAAAASGTSGDSNAAYLTGNNTLTIGGAANGSNSAILGCRISGHVYSGVGGPLKFRLAQGTSSGVATIVRQHSTMLLQKVV